MSLSLAATVTTSVTTPAPASEGGAQQLDQVKRPESVVKMVKQRRVTKEGVHSRRGRRGTRHSFLVIKEEKTAEQLEQDLLEQEFLQLKKGYHSMKTDYSKYKNYCNKEIRKQMLA